jgi:hypothetical protein
MKKVILVLGMITMGLSSCKKEDVQPLYEVEEVDCDCDRVVSVNSFNIISDNGQVPFYDYVTINDCTQIQKSFTLYYSVAIGYCL